MDHYENHMHTQIITVWNNEDVLCPLTGLPALLRGLLFESNVIILYLYGV